MRINLKFKQDMAESKDLLKSKNEDKPASFVSFNIEKKKKSAVPFLNVCGNFVSKGFSYDLLNKLTKHQKFAIDLESMGDSKIRPSYVEPGADSMVHPSPPESKVLDDLSKEDHSSIIPPEHPVMPSED